jgi:hypothetical protein
MRKSIAIAVAVAFGASAAAAGAVNVPTNWYGSDTLIVLTENVISAVPFGGGPYLGGGSSTGQSAMIAGTNQQTAPMAKMLTGGSTGICTFGGGSSGSKTTNADAVVFALDSVDIYAANLNGTLSTCSSPSSNAVTSDGLASTGSAFFGPNGNQLSTAVGLDAPQNWKYVLALVYGGLDITTGVADCNQPARKNLVANWGNLFANSCTNPNSVCSATVGTTGTGDGIHSGQLWHAFRRDDASGVADLLATLIGLENALWSGGPSATSNSGFGGTPYCNALNWDTATPNAGCNLGPDDQFVGPGGVLDPSSNCIFSTFGNGKVTLSTISAGVYTTIVPHGYVTGQLVTVSGATATSGTVNVASPGAAVTVTGPLTFTLAGVTGTGTGGSSTSTNDTNSGCNSTTAGGGNHRMPPPGTLGSRNVPANATFSSWDVLPTSFQDNDPIRRPCVGGFQAQTGNPFVPAEEVCNLDGNLGLVLALPATDFITTLPGLNLGTQAAGANLTQYPVNNCNTFSVAQATQYLNCAPTAGQGTHAGECPNGDTQIGGGCLAPVDTVNQTTQCLNSGSNPTVKVSRISAKYDGRVHNLHMLDGTGVIAGHGAQPKYLIQTQQNGVAGGVQIPFAGGVGRIHSVATVFNAGSASGNPNNVGCQFFSVSDQLACLVQADPCSLAEEGDGAKTYTNRLGGFAYNTSNPSLPGTYTGLCANLAAQGVTLSTVPACNAGTLASDSVRIDGTYPTGTTVTALGSQAVEYQVGRKLSINTILGFGNLTDGTAAGELDFASYESQEALIQPLVTANGFFALGGVGGVGAGAIAAPYCEDFNEQLLCSAATNNNACANNATVSGPSGAIPSSTPPGVIAVGAQSTSPICGNGVKEAYEECDNGLSNGVLGNNCSTICRCAGRTSYESVGGGPYQCQ